MIDKQLKLSDIELAARQLKNIAVNTPLQFSERLSEVYGANIYIKREDLQRCRSFKVRGAYNKIVSLSAKEGPGIVCASAGNHAQGVAYSCASLKIVGTIFMPLTTLTLNTIGPSELLCASIVIFLTSSMFLEGSCE